MTLAESDHRQVVLLKSKLTLNRFYCLAAPERGWRNADEIDDFPDDVVLGIAYPCLEDGLNDFAVIRTTFETIDCFPDDESLRQEFMAMVLEARDTLVRRLSELRDRLKTRQAHFLGTDLNDFKNYAINMAVKGSVRRTLDNMMKVDVYKDVGAMQAGQPGAEDDTMYLYEFRPEHSLATIRGLPPLEFVVRMFDDVLDSVNDESCYVSRFTFDKFIFQKFIALMFVNYATTDPIFYGTNKADYGVALDKDMSDTPLYRAVDDALRDIERSLSHERVSLTEAAVVPSGTNRSESEETSAMEGLNPESEHDALPSHDGEPTWDLPADVAPAQTAPSLTATENGRQLLLPGAETTRQRLVVPLNSITMAAQLLKSSPDETMSTYAQMILSGAQALQATLKEWRILDE